MFLRVKLSDLRVFKGFLGVKRVKLRVLRDPPPLGATHLGLVAALLVKFTSIEFEIGRTLIYIYIHIYIYI